MNCYREMLFDLLGKECYNCYSTKKLHIHHKDKNRKNNKIANLVVLCQDCHSKIHGRPIGGGRKSRRLQEAKAGGYYIYLNKTEIKNLGWKKGDEILPRIYGRDALIVKKGKK
jgi:hypothetical protein